MRRAGAQVPPHRVVVSRRHDDLQEVRAASPAVPCPRQCLSQTSCRFGNGLGMHVVAKSDLSTANSTYASYVLRSHEMVSLQCSADGCAAPADTSCEQVFAFTAPYSRTMPQAGGPVSWYDRQKGYEFAVSHGLGVRAVGASGCVCPS